MSELEQIKQRINDIEKENEQLRNRVDDLEEENDQLLGRVEELEKETNSAMTNSVGAYKQISQLKDQLSGLDTSPDTSENTIKNAETSLEQVCALPDHLVENELSPNQQRARHIALNLRDYSRKTPKGRVIYASDLRTVLRARFGTGHSETVSRVRNFLGDLGGDLVDIIEPRTAGFSPDKKGEKKSKGKMIVVDEELAQRLSNISHQQNHDVVTGATA